MKKKLMTLGISAAVLSTSMMQLTACQETQRENPLLQESTLPFGAPDFSKIKPSDYLPAFEVAIQQTKDEIAQITENKDSATFENTILAYEESGKTLDRVTRTFFALVEADKRPCLNVSDKYMNGNMILFRAKTRSCWKRPTRNLSEKVPCCRKTRWHG